MRFDLGRGLTPIFFFLKLSLFSWLLSALYLSNRWAVKSYLLNITLGHYKELIIFGNIDCYLQGHCRSKIVTLNPKYFCA